MKMTGLEVAILTHDDTHYGHVPCRPPLVMTRGVGDTIWVRKAACDCYIQNSMGLDVTTTLGYTGFE